MIPEATLHQIQDRVDIVEVVGAAMPLLRAGRNFKANCPFHGEKTPSFYVNPDKQIFHCFGCGAGGNVFTFLMKFEKRDFRDVVESLAERVGVEIPKDKMVAPEILERTNKIELANRLAADFYHRYLVSNPEGGKAKLYLQTRGLSDQTIEDFKLGYAPDAWLALLDHLRPQFKESFLEKSGLVMAGKEGRFYDRFRKRIIFPILDIKGNSVAFGARVLDDSLPKYLNSPETEIYTKGRHLYGLYQARAAIRDEDAVAVVEGYMDVIGCYQAGVKNVVASLGTALTTDQVRMIKRHTRNVFMLYDADAAGEMATLRGLELFLEEGLEVKIIRLPEGYDPDEYILEKGVAAFRETIRGAKTLFEYKLALLKKKYDPTSIDGKVKIANELVSLFSRVKNEILVSAWIKELSKELQLSEAAVTSEIYKTKQAEEKRQASEGQASRIAQTPMRPAEKILLGLFLESQDYWDRAKQWLAIDDFEDVTVKKILAQLDRLHESREQISVSHLVSLFKEDAECVRVIAWASAEADRVPEKEKAFEDCLTWMKHSRIKSRREWLRTQIEHAHKSGDQSQIQRLMQDFNELNKGMRKKE